MDERNFAEWGERGDLKVAQAALAGIFAMLRRRSGEDEPPEPEYATSWAVVMKP